ncbi:hypothetical protein BZG15_28595, partial [Escherichia coli]|nr:hypothetical protein [Escherichia coli]
EAIRSHAIEQVGKILRGYLPDMKCISVAGLMRADALVRTLSHREREKTLKAFSWRRPCY